MKKKIISIFLCIVIQLALASTAVAAEKPFEHNVADGVVEIKTCGEECPGHIITGTAREATNNIQILSGNHTIILKNLDLERVFSEQPASTLDPNKPDMLKDLSAIYIASNVGNVEFSIVGEVKIASEFGISGEQSAITLKGDEASSLDIFARYSGLYANDISIDGGKYNIATDSAKGPQAHSAIYSLDDLTISDADVTASAGNCSGGGSSMVSIGIYALGMTVENSIVNASGGDVDKQQGNSYGIRLYTDPGRVLKVTNSDITVASGDASKSYGIDGPGMELEDSSITAEGGDAQDGSFGVSLHGKLDMKGSKLTSSAGTSDSLSVGLSSNFGLTAENSSISACGDEAENSMGIFTLDSVEGTNSEIAGVGGVGGKTSIGLSANRISINGGMIRGIADECENNESYGIFLYESGGNAPSFELTDANLVAEGSTQGVYTKYAEFSGISYKADENAEAVKIDLEDCAGKDLYLGKTCNVIYNANGLNAEVPASEAHCYEEVFALSKDVPVAKGYEFVCWNSAPDGSGISYNPGDEVRMGNTDMEFYAMWKRVNDGGGNGGATTDDQQASSIPPTGDSNNIGLWLIALIASAAGITSFSMEQRKRKAMK